ncbi:MAG: hypothetical protein KTR32_11675 [Granulosicoccus sp.]|nr:hypothetical protein [Granulosicoccus sp.]
MSEEADGRNVHQDSESSVRVALGIVPDAHTAILLCEELLDCGCERQKILLIDAQRGGQLFAINKRFPLQALSELDATSLGATLSAYMLVPVPEQQSGDLAWFESLKQRFVNMILATHALVDATCDLAWSSYMDCLEQGKVIVTLQLDGLAQDIQYSKLILSQSIDRFETLSINF